MQLLKSFAAPGHPFAKFGTGNLATLRDGAAGGGTEGGADGVGTATEGGGQARTMQPGGWLGLGLA